jgi:seryl-tRNA synthetase
MRDSLVLDKVNQFNSLTMQSKQLERKTADAALKRAMLGREEAESEMRRYREEARQLRKQVEEGKERERRVGERLETVMVSVTWRPSEDLL